MKRIVSLWLPHWRTDLTRRMAPNGLERAAVPPDEPLVLIEETAGTTRLAAVCPVAAGQGLGPSMTLADARALVPYLVARPADPVGAARGLARLAAWALRFTPWTATDGADGLTLDVTGCGHLFGGEAALCARLRSGVARLGFTGRVALADTVGAAWALARFGAEPDVIVPAGRAALRAALAPLPVAALRIAPEAVAGLGRVGLRRVGALFDLPRAPLAARYGASLVTRLDQALGRAAEPVSPHRPQNPFQARRAFVEPVADGASIAAALDGLLVDLCAHLSRRGRGARRLGLALLLADDDRRDLIVGTSRPSRAAPALARLFAERLDGLDIGGGVEAMVLSALATNPLGAVQNDMEGRAARAEDLAHLVDRVAGRLGDRAVARFVPRASHLPERAVGRAAPLILEPRPWPNLAEETRPTRPLRLLPRPEPIEVMAMLPDRPPVLFRWRGRAYRVARSEGPERIAAEWWRKDGPTRDYYRVEDDGGGRFWLFRAGLYATESPSQPDEVPPRWYLHGLFA